jgi:hypothetical protein
MESIYIDFIDLAVLELERGSPALRGYQDKWGWLYYSRQSAKMAGICGMGRDVATPGRQLERSPQNGSNQLSLSHL